jgi:hypothetical protein
MTAQAGRCSGPRGDARVLRAFGLSLTVADGRPPGAWREQSPLGPQLALRRASAEEIERAWSGRAALGWEAHIDGAPLLVEIGQAGDHRFVHGKRAVHHLSADGRTLLCAPTYAEDLLWWRVVLDSVLFSAALLRGVEALHAGAIAFGREAVAITASAGGGKSTLLAELLARGFELLSDDVLALEARAGAAPLAHPGPPLMTLPAAAMRDERRERLIAPVAGERWTAVPAHAAPLPLRALVLLDRRAGRKLAIRPVTSPFATLIGAMLRFPRTPEREAARFELASALASHTAVWQLSADSFTPPPMLADTVLAALSDPPQTVTLR